MIIQGVTESVIVMVPMEILTPPTESEAAPTIMKVKPMEEM